MANTRGVLSEESAKQYCKCVRKILKLAQWRMEDFAMSLGVSRATVSRLLTKNMVNNMTYLATKYIIEHEIIPSVKSSKQIPEGEKAGLLMIIDYYSTLLKQIEV